MLKPQRLLKPNKQPFKKEPLLLLGFDDGNISNYTIAQPEMELRGLKGVSFINPTTIVGSGVKMSWQQVKDLHQKDNWEIECHFETHDDLTTLSDVEIRTGLEAVNNAFIANGLPIPRHHTYPFFRANQNTRSVLSEYRVTGRVGSNLFNYYESIDLMRYYSFKGDTGLDGQAHLDKVKGWITQCIDQKAIMSLHFHHIVETVTDDWQISEVHFIELLDFVVASGITVVGADELYQRVMAYRSA